MPHNWLNVSHVPQTSESDCLVACVAMVLDYWGSVATYANIAEILETRWFGTPARNILLVQNLGFQVLLAEYDLVEIAGALAMGHPIIAFVNTADLPHWAEDSDHALVIIGLDEQFVYANDPYFHAAPQSIPQSAFALSQLRFDNLCALIVPANA